MMKVLIADDEKIGREGLRDVINWKSLGLEVVCCATNGQAALDYIHQHSVDILITDIRMPQMDGLTLLQHLSEQAESPTSIILSGFNDFRYAQRAIKYGVINYLLKPIRPTELKTALSLAIEKRALQVSRAPDEEQYAQYHAKIRLAAHEICDALAHAVARAEEKEALAFCGQLRTLFLSDGYASDLYKKYAFRCVYQSVHAAEDYLGQDIPYFDNIEPMEKLSCAQGYENISLHLQQCVRDLCSYIQRAQAGYKKRIASDVITIVHHRYSNANLSVTQLANELEITPNYLSALFKRQMQMTFTEYLENYRLEKAKLLLGDVRYKVYEVAAMVGYGDSKHFSRVFKGRFGHTPKAFRSIALQTGQGEIEKGCDD